jgi:hypothetical protein
LNIAGCKLALSDVQRLITQSSSVFIVDDVVVIRFTLSNREYSSRTHEIHASQQYWQSRKNESITSKEEDTLLDLTTEEPTTYRRTGELNKKTESPW